MKKSSRKDWVRDRAVTTKKGRNDALQARLLAFIFSIIFIICIIGVIQIATTDYTSESSENDNTSISQNIDETDDNIIINSSENDIVGENSDFESLNNDDSTMMDLAEEFNPDDYDFSEAISTFTVNHSSSSNRDYNMNLACEKINGMILEPNQEFNWYGSDTTPAAVGPATKEAGFKEAGVIINKKPSKGYGGGVCQVATTLFNAIEVAGIQPTEIHHHSIGSSYVPKGKDATVSYNENSKYCKNFVFTNTLDFPIMIQMSESNGDVSATILKGTPKAN